MTVAIYGATGWTAAHIVAALQRDGVPLLLSGRDPHKLATVAARLPIRVRVRAASLEDPASLRSMLESVRLVVNCAGPFFASGTALVDAAIAAGVHYLDVSGEESSVHQIYREYGEVARRRGSCVCPGFAAKGALGHWGAELAGDALGSDRRLDEVAVAYAHATAEYFRPSISSVLSAAGQGFVRGPSAAERIVARRFCFAAPFGSGLALRVPGPEDVSIPRHLQVGNVESYIALDPGGVVNGPWASLSLASARLIPLVGKAFVSSWGRRGLASMLRPPSAPTSFGALGVAIEARRARHTLRLGIATSGAYAVTADIVALGVQRILAAGAAAGVSTPSELCPADLALRTLEDRGAIRVYVSLRDDRSRRCPAAPASR